MLDQELVDKVYYANEDYENIKSYFYLFYEQVSKIDEKIDKLGVSTLEICENKFSLKFLDITFAIEISLVNLQNENKGRVTFSRVFFEDGVEKKEKIGTELYIYKKGNMKLGNNILHVSQIYDVEEIVVKWLNEYLESVSKK